MSKMSRTEETRKNLIEAFWELYREKPLMKITVKEITDKAGYNRGTFYTYFSDVYEMQDILKKSLIPEKDMILDPLMSLERSGGRVFDSFEKTNVYMRENKERIAVMIGPEGDPSFVHDFKMEIRKIIMSYVNSIGIKEPRKFEYIIEYQISALIGIFQLWVEKNEDMDEYELARMMEVVSHNGVTSMMESMLNDKYK